LKSSHDRGAYCSYVKNKPAAAEAMNNIFNQYEKVANKELSKVYSMFAQGFGAQKWSYVLK
jgi:hypothetical protein